MRIQCSYVYLVSLPLYHALTIDLSDPSTLRSSAANLSYSMLSIYANNASNTPDYQIGTLPDGMFWWNAGAMWDTMSESWALTGDTSYLASIMQAISYQAGPTADFLRPEFTGTWGNDDIAFWAFSALTSMEYGLPFPEDKAGIPSKWQSWFSISDNVFNGMVSRWNVESCNGGLKWQVPPQNPGYDYKNSISNGGFFQIAARLYRFTGNQTYLDWAGKVWDWSSSIRLIDANSHNIYDGSDDTINCTGINHDLWSYNAGVYLGGAAYLYNATAGSSQQEVWADRARALLLSANATFTSPFTNATNIIYEKTCELNPIQDPTSNGNDEGGCNADQVTFKAFLARWLSKTALLAPFLSDIVTPILDASLTGSAIACSGYIPAALTPDGATDGIIPHVGINGSICAQHLYSSSVQIKALSEENYFGTLTNGQKLGHPLAALEVVLGSIQIVDKRPPEQGGPRQIQTASWKQPSPGPQRPTNSSSALIH